MVCNVGGIDRALRVVVGLSLGLAGILTGNMVLWVIGFIPLLTGLFRFCPVYPLLKVSSCKEQSSVDAAS